MPINQAYNAHNGMEKQELDLPQWFGANVSNIVSGGDRSKCDGTIFNTFPDEMVTNIDMLGLAVVDQVFH